MPAASRGHAKMPSPSSCSSSRLLRHLLLGLVALPNFTQGLGKADSWSIVGETGASAQQLFLATEDKLIVVDKTENNPATINGHPARLEGRTQRKLERQNQNAETGNVADPNLSHRWATEYALSSHTYKAIDIKTNSFCAGGNQMGNGSWAVVGGNQAVTTMGVADSDLGIVPATNNSGAYDDLDGGRATRMLTCINDECVFSEDLDGMPVNRWYPTLETLPDGTLIVIGGEMWGGFVNSENQHQSTPTYEFWPSLGDPVVSTFLQNTQPANLYPITFLLPNGLLFMQADWQTATLNFSSGVEAPLPNMTHAQRTYPASGSTAMLPLTPDNEYEPTILMCGGMRPKRHDWDIKKWDVASAATSTSCVSIKPQADTPEWEDDDDLPENRGMGSFIVLPDGRLFLSNGVARGSAGYGWTPWAVGQSFAQDPVLRPTIYNPSAPRGQRFQTNLASSTIGRLYHSSSTLLPDGSIFVAGSNPNADVVNESNNATYLYKTDYRAEIYYPDYYEADRPLPSGVPESISYGGNYFDVHLPPASVGGADLAAVKVALIKTGFSTHAMNMGQRYLQLNHTFTTHQDGSATLHVSQAPPNPALVAPGRALFFVTVNGVPSVGRLVMLGTGRLGSQPILPVQTLPASTTWDVAAETHIITPRILDVEKTGAGRSLRRRSWRFGCSAATLSLVVATVVGQRLG